ncbi:hypothetical protein FB566_1225 [Stackebrandtia endophytica]|uniref:Uncharacterized protein n=1 Tax=Stackebrandtia endophytica TaxID=1496996 RepID=A0A543AT08_9ACTN|nr:hypothetical protein [Stackebrandtia endophytica]TQL75713.1 hypothetical protein FB566_1225 [Stackebrandtia endophytica]
MINDLEETLRDELSARAGDLPASPDLADLVIGRAHRVRKRRRMAAGAFSLLLVLAGVTSWSAVTSDWWHGTDAEVLADAAAELGEFSVLSSDGDILTGTGDLYSSDLATAVSAVEVHGGWVVTGSLEGDPETTFARYVGLDGENSDLGSGEEISVFTSERGDAVAVEMVREDEVTAEAYVVTSNSNILSRGTVGVPRDARIVGMTNTAVWMDNTGDGAESLSAAASPTETWLWTFSQSSTSMRTITEELPVGTRLLQSVATNRLLATVPGSDPDDLCLATATVGEGVYLETPTSCFSDLSLSDIVVGPDGHQVLGYVQPSEPTEEDPGEWVWLPLNNDSLVPTGFIDFETKPFFTYHDVAFYDPDGTWYDIEGMKLGIPPLDGQPIPIKHVPTQE